MARVSKRLTKLHNEAEALVDSDKKLTVEERELVLEQWNPMVSHNVGWSAAFFTPMSIAYEMQIETMSEPRRVLDLFAGTGRLAFAKWSRHRWCNTQPEIF